MPYTLKQVVTSIRDRFNEELQTKSGWGKNELKQVHDNIIIEVLSEIDEDN